MPAASQLSGRGPTDVVSCVEVLRPSQPNWVMSSMVSLPNHTFTGQASSSKRLTKCGCCPLYLHINKKSGDDDELHSQAVLTVY